MDCVICLEEIGSKNQYKCEICKNIFHFKCIDIWVNHNCNHNCPLCRRDIFIDSCEYEEYPDFFINHHIDTFTGILTITTDDEIRSFNLNDENERSMALEYGDIIPQIVQSYDEMKEQMETMNFLFES